MTSAVIAAIVFLSCRPEYVAPIQDDCLEVWNADTTMIHPSVCLDYPGNENGVVDAADIIFSDYDVQLYNAITDEMMEQAYVSNYQGYEFKPVEPGTYYLRFIIPDGYNFVMMDEGSSMFDSDSDSDVISEAGFTDVFEIQCHEQLKTIKAIIQKL